jgi:hypothetical protein
LTNATSRPRRGCGAGERADEASGRIHPREEKVTANQAAESPEAALMARFEELVQGVKVTYDPKNPECHRTSKPGQAGTVEKRPPQARGGEYR